MAKSFRLFICIMMCLLLFGCAKGIEKNEAAAPPNTTSNTTAVVQADESTTLITTSKADKTTVATTKKAEAPQTEKELSKSTSKSSVTTKKADGKTTTAKATQTTAVSQALSKESSAASTSPSNESETTESQTTTLSQIYCTYTIDSTSVLENKDKLKAGHEEYLSPDGYILNAYSTTVENGATVYDALQTICNDNGIKLTSRKSAYGMYIIGFNNIDEKDCGAQSGWTYTVNGKYPPKSADKYLLQNNDNVVFIYSCS